MACANIVFIQLHCNECNESIHGGKFIGLTVCALCVRACLCLCMWFKLGAHCGVRFIHTHTCMAYCKMMIVRTHNDTFEQYFSTSSFSLRSNKCPEEMLETTYNARRENEERFLKEHVRMAIVFRRQRWLNTHTHVSASNEMKWNR